MASQVQDIPSRRSAKATNPGGRPRKYATVKEARAHETEKQRLKRHQHQQSRNSKASQQTPGGLQFVPYQPQATKPGLDLPTQAIQKDEELEQRISASKATLLVPPPLQQHGLSDPQNPTTRHSTSTSHDVRTKDFVPPRFQLRHIRLREAGPQTLLSASPSDPFNSSAISINHRMHELIHHYTFQHTTTTNPFIYSKDNFYNSTSQSITQFALLDAASVHAIVAVAGYHQVLLKQSRPDHIDWRVSDDIRGCLSEARYHHSEAVRFLNEKFQNGKDTLSVPTLISAAMLSVCTIFTGDKEQRTTHHKGLLKMIELRGGINTLPRRLLHHISRIDSNISWIRQSELQLPMYRSRFRENGPLVSAVDICSRPMSDLLPSLQCCTSKVSKSSPFQNTIFETFLYRELFSTACELKGLTYILDLYLRQPSKIGPFQREFFEDTYAATQHSLVSFPCPTTIGSITSIMYYRQHCWRLAALIYFNIAIRCWGQASDMIASLVDQLISSLQVANLSSMWSDSPEVLLWMVFIGRCATRDKINSDWLLLEVRHGVRLLNLRSGDKLEGLLKSFLYRESIFQGQLYTTWQEINTYSQLTA